MNAGRGPGPVRAAALCACIATGWTVFLGAAPAHADNCPELLDQRGKAAILTDQEVLDDCLRTGKGWAVTTGGVVTLGGVAIGTIGLRGRGVRPKPPTPEAPEPPPPPQTQDERDKARDCARLRADFEGKRAKKDNIVDQLDKAVKVLESMYGSQAKNARALEELASMRREALAYLIAAGLVAGLTAGAVGAGYAMAAATRLASASRIMAMIGEGMEAAAGVGGFQMGQVSAQMMMQSFGMEAMAMRLIAGGAVGGTGAGALTGTLVQDFMTDSMGRFNQGLDTFNRMVSDFENDFRTKQQELQFAGRELVELKDRLQRECQISVDIGRYEVYLPSRSPRGIRA